MRIRSIFATAAALALMLPAIQAYGQGANKAAVFADDGIILRGSTDGFRSETVMLADETVRTEDSGALLVNLTMECAIGSFDVDFGLNFDFRAAGVVAWVEVDGEEVPKSRVRLCAHALFQFKDITNDIDFDDFIELQLELFGGAHGFSWPLLGLSADRHRVVVKVQLRAFVLNLTDPDDEGIAAIIGKRVVVIQDVKVKQGETLGNDNDD